MYSFTLDFNPRYDFVRIPRVFFKYARYRYRRRIYSDGDNEHAKKRYRMQLYEVCGLNKDSKVHDAIDYSSPTQRNHRGDGNET